jgi:hypothetical protein
VPQSIAPHEPPNLLRELAVLAICAARKELGHGESEGNNLGPDVVRYRGGQGGSGSWCAAFVSYAYEQAAEQIALRMPFERSHGARQLTRRIAAVGRWLDLDVEVPQPGDVICWPRGLAWQGHVEIVDEHCADDPRGDVLITIGGNRGSFPSLVRRYDYPRGVWRSPIVGVARLWG